MLQTNSGILGTGSYLPKEEVSNDEIALRTGATAEWIERKTQIRTRRYAAPDEATSDLAAKAAIEALERSGVEPDQLDYLLVSTSTGDFPQPPTSTLVQELIGAHNAACLDLNVVCSGFVFALEMARGIIARKPDALVLVVAADLYSRILDFTDPKTAALFADGAGAAVVGAVPPPYGILDLDLTSQGVAHHLIRVEAGGSRRPASRETVEEGAHFFKMDGRGVRDFVLAHVPPALARLATSAGTRLDRIDHFVPHQANGVLISDLVREAGLGNAQTHRVVEKYGNMGSASVPVALDDANRAGLLKDGDLVLLSGFGGGMSIGSCLLRWAVAA